MLTNVHKTVILILLNTKDDNMSAVNPTDYVNLLIERETNDFLSHFKKIEQWQLEDLEEDKIVLMKNVTNLLKEFRDFQLFFQEDNTKIFQYLPLDYLTSPQQIQVLDHLMDLKNKVPIDTEDKMKKGNGKNVFIGNKVVHNLKKISFDLPEDRFDHMRLVPMTNNRYISKEMNIKSSNRRIIRQDPQHYYQIKDHIQTISQYIVDSHESDTLYPLCNIITDVVLQAVIYWVIANPHVSIQRKKQILTTMEHFLDESTRQPKIQFQEVDLSTAIPIFVAFLKYRNRYGEHEKVSNILLEEQQDEPTLFQIVPTEFQVYKENSPQIPNLKQILTEGVRCDNFEQKLSETKRIIDLFSQRGRNLSTNSLLDLKVVFRELYLSKSKYKTTASSIIKKWETADATGEILPSQERFVNEKISRGQFREHNPIELYDLKNTIQGKIYKFHLENFLTYDLRQICKQEQIFCETMLNLAFESLFVE